jgi:branched-chain amino acid transport system permease protein
VLIFATMLAFLGLLLFFMTRTRFGRQVRAVAVSEKTAELMGINPAFVYAQTFFISGALAGIAGVLIGIAFNSVHFLMGEPYMLRAFVVIVLGGLGSISGAVIAGLALGIIQTLTVAYVSTGLSDTVIFSLLFLTLLFKPTGLFGNLRLEKRVARA